mgnify:CR=1 FL=1
MTGKPKYKIPCQTINKQNKLPCKAKGIYCKTTKKYRCRIHGGFSNGQKTLEGKIKAYKNLPQFKNLNDEEVRTYIQSRRGSDKTFNERNAFNADLFERRISKLIESL